MKEAIQEVQAVTDKPSLIICRTVIALAHRIKPGREEHTALRWAKKKGRHGRDWAGRIRLLKSRRDLRASDARRKGEKRTGLEGEIRSLGQAYPELADKFTRRMSGDCLRSGNKQPRNILPTCKPTQPKIATVKLRKIP
ncbi:hypothetical protein ACNKHK_16000 [Shigella flexneri]